MKNLKLTGVIAVLAVAAVFSSCKKERTCECVTTYEDVFGTGAQSAQTAVNDQRTGCWTSDMKSYSASGDTLWSTTVCEKK